MSKHEDARDRGRQGGEKQTGLFQPKYDGSDDPGTCTPRVFFFLLPSDDLMSYVIAEQNMRPQRRAPYSATARLVHSPKSSMSRLRTIIFKPLRAHQTKSIPRPEHAASQGFHGAIVRRYDRFEGGAFDSL
jgi:hypothetical protein